MSHPHPHVSDRFLDVLHFKSRLTLSALAAALEEQLKARPELGLFINESDSLIRIGGVDLHGDFLIRPSNQENERSLLVAYRQGDRAALEELRKSTSSIWQISSCPHSAAASLGLLNLVQYEVILGPYNRIEFTERAQEDAFCCREFKALAALRRRLAELNERAARAHDLVGIVWNDCKYKEMLAEVATPTVVLHKGEKVRVCLRKRINTRRGSSLTLHFTLRPNRRVCLIGALTESLT